MQDVRFLYGLTAKSSELSRPLLVDGKQLSGAPTSADRVRVLTQIEELIIQRHSTEFRALDTSGESAYLELRPLNL